MGQTIRVKDEDHLRLLNMRNSKRRFIKDVITHLIGFYDNSDKTIFSKRHQCPKCQGWSNYSIEIKNPQTLEEKAKC